MARKIKLNRTQKRKKSPVFPDGAVVHRRVASGPKMADALVEFARPLLDEMPDNSDAQEWERCLLPAAIVWNGVVTNEEEKTLESLEKLLGKDEDVRLVIDDLFERKRTMFSEDNRMILEVRAEDTPQGVQVLAASIPFNTE